MRSVSCKVDVFNGNVAAFTGIEGASGPHAAARRIPCTVYTVAAVSTLGATIGQIEIADIYLDPIASFGIIGTDEEYLALIATVDRQTWHAGAVNGDAGGDTRRLHIGAGERQLRILAHERIGIERDRLVAALVGLIDSPAQAALGVDIAIIARLRHADRSRSACRLGAVREESRQDRGTAQKQKNPLKIPILLMVGLCIAESSRVQKGGIGQFDALHFFGIL
ncbi:hypothetical protein PPNSA23_43560 [Phyllobacterium phragmitis]|uniref:Uncharacterized protein n=1 Tax=Phyllobacterium phragmitis TaxID=2670329 RepID=A0ABQ0H655_9HYPH